MQEKSALNFPFNTQVQEKSVENGSWIAVKVLIGRSFRVDSGKGGAGDILQSDISHLQLNTLLCVERMVNLRLVFFACAIVCSLYISAWHTFRELGWRLPNDANIPGFLMMVMAQPWSTLAYSFQPEMEAALGEPIRYLVTAIVVALGFALNVTATLWLVVSISRKVREHKKKMHGDKRVI